MLLLKKVKEEILHSQQFLLVMLKKLNELIIKIKNCKYLFESRRLLSELDGSEVLRGLSCTVSYLYAFKSSLLS